jgi:hypothetical protein
MKKGQGIEGLNRTDCIRLAVDPDYRALAADSYMLELADHISWRCVPIK